MEKEQAECPIFGDCDDKTLSSADKNMKKENGGVFTALPTEKALITDRVASRQGFSSRKVKNAFELFPVEIWEMMFDQMDDSKDILSVLRGIPQLDISVKPSQKRFWYISEILPSLFDFIEQKDVLNLRLVCKDWQRRVDHFLPNQPFYRAYSEKLHKDYPDFWMFMQESTKIKESRTIPYYYSNVFRDCGPSISTDDGSGFGVSEQIRSCKIMDEALEHPRNRNPFVFRKLNVHLDDDNDDEGEYGNLQVQRMLSFLEQFGSHLWYLYITLGSSEYTETWVLGITNLIKMLEFTPNLKCLSLNVLKKIKENEPYNDAKLLEKSLSPLLFLESLEVSGDMDQSALEVSAGLIMRYGAQIRRLKLPLNHWRPEFKEAFPQLTELELFLNYHGSPLVKQPKSDVSTFHNLLLTISAPHLVKIKFIVLPPESGLSVSFQRDILKWLKRFPKIRCLEMKCLMSIDLREDKSLLAVDPVTECIPSLQTLKIVDEYGISYNFLRCFPALRHLEMQSFCWPTEVNLSILNSVIYRHQLQTANLYEFYIWEDLPKLRTISLKHGHWSYCNKSNFNLDTYEKMKNFGIINLEKNSSDDDESVSDESEPGIGQLSIE